MFVHCQSEQTVEQTLHDRLIRDAKTVIWHRRENDTEKCNSQDSKCMKITSQLKGVVTVPASVLAPSGAMSSGAPFTNINFNPCMYK